MGQCGNGTIRCNPVIFGEAGCVVANSRATSECFRNAKPADEVALSLDKKGWEELSAINEYCHAPLSFQKLICDRFYQARLKALNEFNPCPKLEKACIHSNQDLVIQICELQGSILD